MVTPRMASRSSHFLLVPVGNEDMWFVDRMVKANEMGGTFKLNDRTEGTDHSLKIWVSSPLPLLPSPRRPLWRPTHDLLPARLLPAPSTIDCRPDCRRLTLVAVIIGDRGV